MKRHFGSRAIAQPATRTRNAATALLLAMSLLFASCSAPSHKADAWQAWRSPAGTRINILVDTCKATLRSKVVESDQEVRVLVTARNGTNGDCADSTEIILAQPLGNRPLIDESDGQPIPVTLNERIPDAP